VRHPSPLRVGAAQDVRVPALRMYRVFFEFGISGPNLKIRSTRTPTRRTLLEVPTGPAEDEE
jgi:hypothetical protein